MKYIIKNKKEPIFIKNEYEWTPNLEEAVKFSRIGEAMTVASKVNKLTGSTAFTVYPIEL